MQIIDALDLAGAVGFDDGPHVSVLHDSPEFRVVLFRFREGQHVPLHRTPASVLLTVLSGTGEVTGLGVSRTVSTGHVAACAPHEPHAIRAESADFAVLATIAPGPNGD